MSKSFKRSTGKRQTLVTKTFKWDGSSLREISPSFDSTASEHAARQCGWRDRHFRRRQLTLLCYSLSLSPLCFPPSLVGLRLPYVSTAATAPPAVPIAHAAAAATAVGGGREEAGNGLNAVRRRVLPTNLCINHFSAPPRTRRSRGT